MTQQPFVHRHRIRLAQTDAAGVVFFTETLAMTHLAYEVLLDELGVSVGGMLREGTGLPIVEASARLLAPLRVGDDVDIALALLRLSSRSFTLSATLTMGTGEAPVVGRCTTVHVCVDRDGKPTALPEALSAGLRARLPDAPAD